MSLNVIIRKEKIRVRTSDAQYALQLRKRLNDDVQFQLNEMLEKVFAPANATTTFINIEKITIDLGKINSSDFEQHFVRLIEAKLLNEINNFSALDNDQTRLTYVDLGDVPESPVRFNSPGQQLLAALLYFLENGSFPWWYKRASQQKPAGLLNNFSTADIKRFFQMMIAKRISGDTPRLRKVLQRFFIHLPREKYDLVIEEVLPVLIGIDLKAQLKMLVEQRKALKRLQGITESAFHRQLVAYFLSGKKANSDQVIDDFITHIKSSEQVENERAISKNQKPPLEKNDNYISNAGLILLHPFIPTLFYKLNLLDERSQFRSITDQHRGAVLFYYLQYGSEQYAEWEMLFNKILCGLSWDEVIAEDITLTAEEKNECETVLQTVIEYWDALKTSSVEALQQTFLAREGKISWKENHWLLQVERTGVDILLDKIPWGFGTVKFPWLNAIIYTEW